jgi:hypothetical protein
MQMAGNRQTEVFHGFHTKIDRVAGGLLSAAVWRQRGSNLWRSTSQTAST